MSIEANKEVVRRYIEEGLNGRSRQALAELLAPDFRFHGREPTLNRTGTRRISWARALVELPPYVIEDMVAEGSLVATRVSRGPLYSESLDKMRRENEAGPPTGITIAFPVHHITAFIHRLSQGKIAEEWVKEGIRGIGSHF